MAIITRWRMPPENSCGYMAKPARGLGDADKLEHRDRRARAPRLAMPRCARSTSVIWRADVRNGLSEVIGSWKIIAIFAAADRVQLGRAGRFRISRPR